MGRMAVSPKRAETNLGGDRVERKLDGDKAQRIVSAMRSSVGLRGAAGSTFDHVAQEAGVSRGLLHYYFGSKERLLVEVMRHDCDIRMARLERILANADSVDAIIEALVSNLREFIAEDADTGSFSLIFEMFSASRHNEDIREEMAELYRKVRGHVADVLGEKEREGVVELRCDPESAASVLLALADGITLQTLSDPDWDNGPAFEAGAATASFLLGGRS
jgi:AcrR family transcriptional regulator